MVSGLIGASEDHTLDDLRAKRDQEVAYALAHRIMTWFDTGRDPRPWYFPQVLRITKRWMAECVTYHGGTFPGLLLLAENADEAARRILHESISWQEGTSSRRSCRSSGRVTGPGRPPTWTSSPPKRSTRPGRSAT